MGRGGLAVPWLCATPLLSPSFHDTPYPSLPPLACVCNVMQMATFQALQQELLQHKVGVVVVQPGAVLFSLPLLLLLLLQPLLEPLPSRVLVVVAIPAGQSFTFVTAVVLCAPLFYLHACPRGRSYVCIHGKCPCPC